MTSRIACGTDRAILDAVLASLADGKPCIVPPPNAILGVVDIAERMRPHELVVYTSGSTGSARGIVRTFDSWVATFDPLTSLTGLTPSDVVWIPGPLTSTLFLYGALHSAHLGAQVLLSDMPGHTATVVHAVPALAADILASRADYPDLRLLVVAGDRVPDSLWDAARDAGVELLEYYGAAELSFVAARTSGDGLRAFPGVEIDVRDDVIWVRSSYIANGYVFADESASTGPLRRDGQWATVGDLGSYADGTLIVRGRGDSGVTVGGHTVVTDDVEHVLRRALGTTDVAVTGVPHPRFGAIIIGIVSAEPDDRQLRAAAELLPGPARPRRWIRVERLPRTASGKVDRRAIRALAEAG